MGDISIDARLYPYRLKMTERQAAELTVELTNESAGEKRISLEIFLPEVASFDKIGSNSRAGKKIDPMKANEKITFKFPLYLSGRANVGSFDGKIKVQEHLHEFGYVSHSYTKDLAIRIVK